MGHCKVPDCSGVTEYDENAQAILCTTCGTVATQDILTHERDIGISADSLYFGPTTLKSLRRVGSVLTGQSSKEDRDRRNTIAIHQYIRSLLTKLTCAGLAARACSLFDQVRIRGKYKWGKKAVLVSGACMIIVLRESRKGVTISHLASLMDISPRALCRMLAKVGSLLNLHIPPFDPLFLLPALQSHLLSLINCSTPALPQALINTLRPLPPIPVLNLASSLAALLDHLDEFSSAGASALPMACALFIIALEGQAASSLPSYIILAQELGAKVGARKDLVLGRYRDILKVLEDWMADVPWLSGVDHPDNRLGKKRRKTSQRDVIATGIKDVIQFRGDIEAVRKTREAESPVTVAVEVSDESDSGDSVGPATPEPERKRKRTEDTNNFQSSRTSKTLRLIRPEKRRSPISRLDVASLSLLSPSHPFASNSCPLQRLPEHPHQIDELQNWILTSSTFTTQPPPTRLQRLVTLRGGEGKIQDDELFEQGELEGFLRNEVEVAKLQNLFGLERDSSGVTRKLASPMTSPSTWDLADMALWEDAGNEVETGFESGGEILGDWREASPLAGDSVEGDDPSDV